MTSLRKKQQQDRAKRVQGEDSATFLLLVVAYVEEDLALALVEIEKEDVCLETSLGAGY